MKRNNQIELQMNHADGQDENGADVSTGSHDYLCMTKSDMPSANDQSFVVATVDQSIDLRPIDLEGETLTDLKMAELTIKQYGTHIRWVTASGSWAEFDDASGLWSMVPTERIVNKCINVIKALRLSESEKVRKSGSSNNTAIKMIERAERSNFLTAAVNLMRSDLSINVQPSQFDNNPMLIGLQGKQCFDLKNMTVREISSGDYLTKAMATTYDPSAKCDLWERSINEWTCGDKELAQFLKVWAGYSLSGLTRFQKFLFLHGDGKNGKSVFLKIITTLHSRYWVNLRPESLMQQNRGTNASPDIAKLVGVRLVTASELPEGSCFDENLIKSLTGGDTITARHLYKTEFDFVPWFKLLMAGNHKPIIKGADYGFWRRFAYIPFIATIDKPDFQLTDKLLNELPGILNWCIDGWKQYAKDQDISIPKVVQDASDEYKEEMDLIMQWKRECVRTVPGETTKASEVYESYKIWTKNNNYYTMNSNAFARKATQHLGKSVRRSSGNVYEDIQVVNVPTY